MILFLYSQNIFRSPEIFYYRVVFLYILMVLFPPEILLTRRNIPFNPIFPPWMSHTYD